MSGIATAVGLGTAAVGAYAQDRAADKASDTAQSTSQAQLDYARQQADRAREDIARYYPAANEARQSGLRQRLGGLGATTPVVYDQMQRGNMAAQEITAGAMPQYQNAIMGGPVDYSFMQPRNVGDRQGMMNLINQLGGQSYDQPGQALQGMQEETGNATQAAEEEIMPQEYEKRARKMYLDTLGREPDPEGLAFYTQRLRSGWNEEDVARDMIGSTEYAVNEQSDPVTSLYERLLGRTPDQSGQEFYSRQLQNGRPLSEVEREIMGSREYQMRNR